MRTYVIILPLHSGGEHPLCAVESLEGVHAILDALLRYSKSPPAYVKVEVVETPTPPPSF